MKSGYQAEAFALTRGDAKASMSAGETSAGGSLKPVRGCFFPGFLYCVPRLAYSAKECAHFGQSFVFAPQIGADQTFANVPIESREVFRYFTADVMVQRAIQFIHDSDSFQNGCGAARDVVVLEALASAIHAEYGLLIEDGYELERRGRKDPVFQVC